MPTILALVIHGVIAVLLIVGGLFCVHSSFRMMRKNEMPTNNPTNFSGKLGAFEFTIATGTLGALVLCISAIWAGFGYLAVPELHSGTARNGNQTIEVTSDAPLSIQTHIPASGTVDRRAIRHLAQLVSTAGPDHIEAAKIRIPIGDSRWGQALRRALESVGVASAKIHINYSPLVPIGAGITAPENCTNAPEAYCNGKNKKTSPKTGESEEPISVELAAPAKIGLRVLPDLLQSKSGAR